MRDTIEQQLFSTDEWDEIGPGDMTFFDVVLKVAIGEFPVGTKFPEAMLIGSKSCLILIDEDDKEHFFEMNISVGQRIKEEDLLNEDDDPGVAGKMLN